LSDSPKQALSGVELLGSDHNLDEFDCSKHASLTRWLKRLARMNQASGDTRTYIVHRELAVVGYYSLAPGSISRKEAISRATKSAPEPIPIVLLARLAVDKREQGQGIGPALVKDALKRAYAGAEIIGGRAVLVHAMDTDAAAFYRKYGFESCPGLELHLMMLMKDLRVTFGF
jgi:GNAT superfamily N-acetyltransferase